MTVTITHVYDNYDSAENVVRELERAGFTSDQISVVGRKAVDGSGGEEGVGAAATGSTLGGVAGAGAGLLASLGLIAIPGIGPLVAAGSATSRWIWRSAAAPTGSRVGRAANRTRQPTQKRSGNKSATATGLAIEVRRGGQAARRARDAKPVPSCSLSRHRESRDAPRWA